MQFFVRGACQNRQSYLLRCLQNDCCTLSERNLSARYVVSHPGSEKSVRRQMSKRAGERWDRCGYGGQNAPRSRLGQKQVWRLVHSHKLCNIFLIREISHDCDDPRNENQSGPVRSYWGKTNLKRRKDIKFISQIGPLTRFIYLCLGQSRWIQKYKKLPTPQWIDPLKLFDQSPWIADSEEDQVIRGRLLYGNLF